MEFHNKNNYDITLVGSMINYRIPYGICEIQNKGKLIGLKEKPEFSYLVSTGMYVIKGTTLKLIPPNEHFDMTNLIDAVKKNNGEVGVFPVTEKSWMDTGDWNEYKKTVNQLSS